MSFFHIVHFWLKDEHASGEAFDRVLAGVRSLADSPNVKSCRVGVPAGTPREVVDNSYSIQLICEFADKASHDAYQSADDSVHQSFIDNYKQCWTKVLIYDSVEP